ncbi:MAG: cell surface protein SprA [Taibaiella sp.]|nr:cell surface protein SprA [Taibaiella sp.]
MFFIALVVAIAHAAARDRLPFDIDDPAPQTDSPATTAKSATDSAHRLRFPIHDNTGSPAMNVPGRGIDLQDPPNIQKSVEYDADSNRYYFNEKLGDNFLRNPTYMTLDEYEKYQGRQDEQAYWQRRLDALTLFNKKPELPQMYKEGVFDRIFGGNTISVKPQGNVDVTFGGNWQNIKNPTLVQRAQKYGIFNFDMQMNINLVAAVGDKLKLNISNNTKATFDYQNVQKLEYTGHEDEILKKIEAGNISFPLKSSLITGVQSLFGIKTQLQFGKLWITAALAQQKSQRKSATIQGGAQTQQFAIKIDNYEENRDFLLGQYFYDNYNSALQNYPLVNSVITIDKIQVWITNRTGATTGIRDVLCLMDLGEKNPYKTFLTNASGSVYPDNSANRLYSLLSQNLSARLAGGASGIAQSLNLDFAHITARQLTASEFSFNPQLGYILLNTQLNTDDVLGVAYRYTRNGVVHQVGEFAEDVPPDSTSSKILFLKLLKDIAPHPTLPIWKLMMKNVYSLGGLGVARDNFILNILYQDPGGGEKRYIPEGDNAGVPLLTLLNLDRLNAQNAPQPDGVFDFVDGITVNTQQGKIIFPQLEPFGKDLSHAIGNNAQLQRKYLYTILYDSTKTVAQQFQQNDRYILRGSYKSSSSSEIFLGGFNIPQGSVTVTAGGTRLIEGQDYQIDYGLGRLRILNQGILNSGIPINIQYEDNSTFGFQQQNFMGARFDYYFNKKLILGGTFMRLTERPFTQKVTFGDDPIKNVVLGLDANYQTEVPALTRLLDKLPIYSTSSPSFINASGEVATLLPGHAKQINTLDKEGSVYIDDFEGTTSTYDLKLPAIAWTLSSTPSMFPEATAGNQLVSGSNRALLAWYFIEPTLVDGTTSIPDYIKKDPNQHYIRLVQQQDVFPLRSSQTLQNGLSTFDLAFYPNNRGPYNFDATNVNPDGTLTNPRGRWGGIMRPLDNTDFEQSNVEYIQFWVMDPFINKPNSTGGQLYFNLGDVSEDVLKDSRLSFENGIPYPKTTLQLDSTVWGYIPKFQQQVTRAFNNDPAARITQDVGYDELDDVEETRFYGNYLTAIRGRLNATTYQALLADPAGDNYHYYRGDDLDQAGIGILGRYKHYNNPQGNSPITSATASFSSAETTLPESEDINRDNALNEAENYYQYKVNMVPNMQVGTNNIVNRQVSNVKLLNGTYESETWYQFKLPIKEYTNKVGSIADFRSIRFVRAFLSGFQDSTVLRFATLELGRNQWRQYQYSLQTPGENLPQQNQFTTAFSVTSVSVEENSRRTPIPYVIPPGVNRQQASVSNGQTIALNEQALSVKLCALADGDARGIYKEVDVDMRQFDFLRLFIHAESQVGQPAVRDGDLYAFIRIGSDFTTNYYEYRVPLKITLPGIVNTDDIWPASNTLNITLSDLINAKLSRDSKGVPLYLPYQSTDRLGNTIVVVGNPNIGDGKNIMLGVLNPKKSDQTPGDDGLPKCTEVWFNELRLAGTNDKAGYAAAGKVAIQLADLGNVNLSGGMHTQGYGNIDQKIQQRYQDDFYQYAASTNLSLGKLMPRTWGVQLPLFVGYTENVSTPKYNPYDQDVLLTDAMNRQRTTAQRDSLKSAAQDFTSITSVNLTNVRIMGNTQKQPKFTMPWALKNFDFSYSYTSQFKHNPTIANDRLTTQRGGLGYTYSIKARSIEPFKRLIKSKSKWLSLVKDFNFNPLPSNFTFRTDMNRTVDATTVRNIDDGPYQIPTTFYKLFTWNRLYTLRWELTRSLSFDYSATNNAVIDEPYGFLNTGAKKDSVLSKIASFGRNTYYSQTFNATYNVPLQKFPLTDWINVRANYSANYSWTAASLLAYQLGNTIGNTQTEQLSGDFNFAQLYSKMRWYRALSQNNGNKPKVPQFSQPNVPGGQGGKNMHDLRPGIEAAQGQNKAKKSAVPTDTNTHSVTYIYKHQIDSILASGKSFSNNQLDSLKRLQKQLDDQRKKEDKIAKKAARKAARIARRNTLPELNTGEKIAGRIGTMLQRVTVNYSQVSGTTLPGWLDSTRILGINNVTGAPGLNFVYGSQPTVSWLEQQGANGKLSRDSLFNAQFQQTYSQNISATATVSPIPDLRIDLTMTQTFSKAHTELFKYFKDTGTGRFDHLNPFENGSFNISYIALSSMFQPTGAGSRIFKEFLDDRKIISARLGNSNPYTNGLADPNDPNYKKGYTQYSQDLLVPAFIAAYTGKSAGSIALINYKDNNITSNPFQFFFPLPNWHITYNGLSRLPAFSSIFSNFVINHAYTGSMSMNGFSTSLLYRDLYGLGFPSFIDSNSHNYTPFYQVPNVTISQQFNPLIGFDATLRNNISARMEIRRSKTESLSLIDYQVAETQSTEYVIGAGYRVRNVRLPYPIFGITRLKNELNIKLDIGLRDDISSNNYLAQNLSVVSRGQKVLRISPSIDYIVNPRLTLHMFYDRQQTIPYVSNSYPITTTQAGITLRFIFAQ